jgi:hypothetical protein
MPVGDKGMAPVLNPFHRFTSEGAAVGRLLLGYSNLEIDLMNCVQMACGGNLNTVIKAMFGARGEAKRITQAEKLGQAIECLTPATAIVRAQGLWKVLGHTRQIGYPPPQADFILINDPAIIDGSYKVSAVKSFANG